MLKTAQGRCTNGWRLAPLVESRGQKFLFGLLSRKVVPIKKGLPLRKGECKMYMTSQDLFLFMTMLIAFANLIFQVCKHIKKK